MNMVAVIPLICRESVCNFTKYLFFQSEIGFGKIESYTKLDKLGEVSSKAVCLTVNWEIKSKITF